MGAGSVQRVGAGDILPRQLTGARSPLVFGAVLLVCIELTVVALFVTSYFYLRLSTADWPPAGIDPPDPARSGTGVALLLASVWPAWWAVRSLRFGRCRRSVALFVSGTVLATGYLVLNAIEYATKTYTWRLNAYASMDWTMTAYGALHVVALVLFSGTVSALVAAGHMNASRYTGAQALLIYWVFVAASGAVFFATVYLSPHL